MHDNFTDIQFFESVVICMIRNCKIIPSLTSLQSRLALNSFRNNFRLIDEHRDLYKVR